MSTPPVDAEAMVLDDVVSVLAVEMSEEFVAELEPAVPATEPVADEDVFWLSLEATSVLLVAADGEEALPEAASEPLVLPLPLREPEAVEDCWSSVELALC